MVHKVTVKNVHPGLHLLDEPDFVKLDELGHHSLCSDEPKLRNVADKDSDLAVHCHYQVQATIDEVTKMKPDTSQNPHLTCSLVHNLKEDHVGKLHLHHVSLVQQSSRAASVKATDQEAPGSSWAFPAPRPGPLSSQMPCPP